MVPNNPMVCNIENEKPNQYVFFYLFIARKVCLCRYIIKVKIVVGPSLFIVGIYYQTIENFSSSINWINWTWEWNWIVVLSEKTVDKTVTLIGNIKGWRFVLTANETSIVFNIYGKLAFACFRLFSNAYSIIQCRKKPLLHFVG